MATRAGNMGQAKVPPAGVVEKHSNGQVHTGPVTNIGSHVGVSNAAGLSGSGSGSAAWLHTATRKLQAVLARGHSDKGSDRPQRERPSSSNHGSSSNSGAGGSSKSSQPSGSCPGCRADRFSLPLGRQEATKQDSGASAGGGPSTTGGSGPTASSSRQSSFAGTTSSASSAAAQDCEDRPNGLC